MTSPHTACQLLITHNEAQNNMRVIRLSERRANFMVLRRVTDEAGPPADGAGSKWLTKAEAVARLPYSRGTFEKIVRDGFIVPYRIPGTKKLYFKESDVDGLIGQFPAAI